MKYAIIPVIAILVLFVVDFDVLLHRKTAENVPALKQYRVFLFSVALLYICDILWGIFDQENVYIGNYIATILFFLMMSVSVCAWSFYVITYMDYKSVISRIIKIVGLILLCGGLIILIVNFFQPIMFEFINEEYKPRIFRSIFLIAHCVMYAVVSIYAFVVTLLSSDKNLKVKRILVSLLGFVMAAMVIVQLQLPNIAIYSFGYLLCLLLAHTFVVAAQRQELNDALEEGYDREQKQKAELNSTLALAYTDPLTGVKNKHAYVELEDKIDKLIADGEMKNFSVVVFDLNDLKLINDKLGHYAGDKYIIDAVKIIQQFFPDTTIYRFGGDEFVALLEDDNYQNRHDLLDLFNRKVDGNYQTGEPIISTGLSDYIPGKDNTYRAVVSRADERMYIRKKQLKEAGKIDLIKIQEGRVENEISPDKIEKLKAELIRIREESLRVRNPRISFYKAFYQNEEYPLIDLLNNSSCDEVVEINLNDNVYKQLYHVDGKYFVPVVDSSYDNLFEFVSRYIVHPDDREIYDNFMKADDILERLKNSEIPNFAIEHFRYKLQDGDYRYVEQCIITGEENGIAPGVIRLYVFDIQNYKTRQNGTVGDERGVISKGRDSVTNLLLEKEFLIDARNLIDTRPDDTWCLISIDIEHFRFFDEWYGRESGNYLLAKIGAMLAENEKSFNGLSGYFGKDDFAIVMPYNDEKIHHLYDEMREIINSFGLTAGFMPAFGIAMLEKGLALVDAFDRATIASAKAKSDIKNRICTYSDEMQFLAQKEYRLLSEFMTALKNDEITFYLQPQCRASSGKVVGVEALARWIKKDGTIVSPGDFIPVLEKYGFIPDLDQIIWEKVCLSLHEWMEMGHKSVPVSINVSRADIFSLDITKILLDLSDKYSIPRNLLKVEITESSYVEAIELVEKLVDELMANGFSVLMDDFGSGYSSLNMLSNMKLDAIKLDARFLNLGNHTNVKGLRILESVVNMAKSIGLPIIVEGVETKNQLDFLEDLGCRYIQGFYFYRPMPAEDFRKLIADESMVDPRGFVAKLNEQVRIREFLDKNIYSDSMLNNVIGPVAFYSWSGETTDIVRFNEQFYQAVHVNEFAERLEHIERFIHVEDAPKMHNAFQRAMEDKLNGANEILRFYTPDGTVLSFFIHFYYLGKKEGGERFYGSAQNVTELADLQEEKRLVSNYSKDSMMFLKRVNGVYTFSVASRGLADVFDITPTELENELNSGEFVKKRLVNRKQYEQVSKGLISFASENKSFEATLDVYDSNHQPVVLKMSFTCVSGVSNNIEYIVRATIIK